VLLHVHVGGCVLNLKQSEADSNDFGKHPALLEAAAAIWSKQVLPQLGQLLEMTATDRLEKQKRAAAFTER
jgi:hypothetical protein